MGALTNRLGIYLMGGGLTGLNTPPEAMDIDKINAGFQKVDDAIGAFPCTSTTRPASPYPGMVIYERDTEGLAVWDVTLAGGSGGWAYVAGGPFPWMRIYKDDVAPVSGPTDIAWNRHQFFRGYGHTAASDGSGVEVTIQRAGLYEILARVALAAGDVALVARLFKNGAQVTRLASDAPPNTNAFPKVTLQGTIDFAVGDKVKIQAQTSTGAARNLEVSQLYWEMKYAGPVFS